MSRIAYVGGQYVPHRTAAVHIEDRGYQFADGVYEVLAVCGGRLVDEERHLARLGRSLGELRIAPPLADAALRLVLREIVRRNRVGDGLVYIQVTRGTAPREHAFPARAKAVLVVTARRRRPVDPGLAENGVAVITIPDLRWQRCDIKAVALTATVLGKQAARAAGAYEASLVVCNRWVHECSNTPAWIVTNAGAVATHPADRAILNGVTRLAVLDILRGDGQIAIERPFTVAEAKQAREAFLTSTTNELLPVVRIDGDSIGNGAPGLLTRRLRELYRAHVARAAAAQ